jgi:hypothetical protein
MENLLAIILHVVHIDISVRAGCNILKPTSINPIITMHQASPEFDKTDDGVSPTVRSRLDTRPPRLAPIAGIVNVVVPRLPYFPQP